MSALRRSVTSSAAASAAAISALTPSSFALVLQCAACSLASAASVDAKWLCNHPIIWAPTHNNPPTDSRVHLSGFRVTLRD
jgi:hypothetical protein